MSSSKREKLMRKVDNHLRKTSRYLIKINTEEEALQYLTDSFRSELYCDFVGVVLEEGGQLLPKAWSGNIPSVTEAFPFSTDDCSSKLFRQSMTYKTAEVPEKCHMAKVLKKANIKTWFTVPLKDDIHHFGFCIVGFLSFVPLLDMEVHFEEFGKDMAVAMAMAREKETQLKKIEGIEWISKNLSLDAPLEQHIAELTSRAGKGTNADFACIYLYNEKENCFVFQQPAYGKMEYEHKIMIQDNYMLKDYFPFLETPGGNQLTIPLFNDLKPIGVLHVGNEGTGVFSEDDLRMLELLSKHVAALLENARLYHSERDHKHRLQFLLDSQQALVKETVEVDNFDGITTMLGGIFQSSVILFDRFMRELSVLDYGHEGGPLYTHQLAERAKEELGNQKGNELITMQDPTSADYYFSFWPVSGGGNLLGYLAIRRSGVEMDEFDRLTVDLARNICSIQFIKQKLVLDAKEQAKDSFISKLLTEKIDNEESIIQYANLFQWDLFSRHRLAVLSIELDVSEMEGSNLLEQQTKKTLVWDSIKSHLSELDRTFISASHDEKFVLLVSTEMEGNKPKKFWATLFESIQRWVAKGSIECKVLMGIGSETENIQDYYVSYQQAVQALNIVSSRFENTGYSLFKDLGSYTILHHLGHSTAIDLFVKSQLGPLIKYSEGKNIDLFNTLHVFLQNNGNVKGTAEELYIHRSSLIYRLERIELLLDAELNDAEVRFNLMMALKLYDMNGGLI
ncbi:helix-turn-helix domain-containing protein [Peribacillus sp. NPDC101480]|uniref:helix-turn-helix domain-containing protein n=1 Tax=Peribacillus sp. NPDC101480 TaxID=3390620 RepID=UPI003CFF9B5F